MGTRHRATGILLSSSRGPVLEVDNGGVYALDLDRDAARFFGQRVTVEGLRSGFDRLDGEWIGPPDRTEEKNAPPGIRQMRTSRMERAGAQLPASRRGPPAPRPAGMTRQ